MYDTKYMLLPTMEVVTDTKNFQLSLYSAFFSAWALLKIKFTMIVQQLKSGINTGYMHLPKSNNDVTISVAFASGSQFLLI